MTEKSEVKVVNIRLVEEPSVFSKERLNDSDSVAEFMQEQLRSYDRECVCVLNLNTANQVISLNITSVGSINRAVVRPAELFKSSILSNASSFIMCHNHPSGNVRPSDQDIEITSNLYVLGRMMGIDMLDHVIVGPEEGSHFSFAEHGMLDSMKRNYQEIAAKYFLAVDIGERQSIELVAE